MSCTCTVYPPTSSAALSIYPWNCMQKKIFTDLRGLVLFSIHLFSLVDGTLLSGRHLLSWTNVFIVRALLLSMSSSVSTDRSMDSIVYNNQQRQLPEFDCTSPITRIGNNNKPRQCQIKDGELVPNTLQSSPTANHQCERLCRSVKAQPGGFNSGLWVSIKFRWKIMICPTTLTGDCASEGVPYGFTCQRAAANKGSPVGAPKFHLPDRCTGYNKLAVADKNHPFAFRGCRGRRWDALFLHIRTRFDLVQSVFVVCPFVAIFVFLSAIASLVAHGQLDDWVLCFGCILLDCLILSTQEDTAHLIQLIIAEILIFT